MDVGTQLAVSTTHGKERKKSQCSIISGKAA